MLSLLPAIEERRHFRQFALQVPHLADGGGALLLRAGQPFLQRFDRGPRVLLRLRLPLLRDQFLSLGLGGQLGAQVLLTLLGVGAGRVVLLLHFLPKVRFQRPETGFRLHVAAAKNLIIQGLQFGAGSVQLHLPLLIALERLRLEQFILLLRLKIQAGFRGADARPGFTLPFLASCMQLCGPLFSQFGFPSGGPLGQLQLALLELGEEGELLLLQLLSQPRIGFTRFDVNLAIRFGLQPVQLLLRLRLHVPQSSFRLRLQLLFTLGEPDLGSLFPLLRFLAPARVHLTHTGLQFALKCFLTLADVLFDSGLLLRKARVGFEGQLLLAELQLMLKRFALLALRLGKLQLLPLPLMLRLAGRLLALTDRLLPGAGQIEGKGFHLQLQLGERDVTGVQGFFRLQRPPGRCFLCGQCAIRHLPADLHPLGSAVLRDFHQLLVMLLDEGRAFRLVGGMVSLQLLAHLDQAIRPAILAQLNLSFDFGFLEIAQGVLLRQHLVERLRQAGKLELPLAFLLLPLLVACGGGRVRRCQIFFAKGHLIGGFTGQAFRPQNLLAPRPRVKPVQPLAKKTETMRRTRLFRLEEGGETNFNHQRRQEGDDECEHRINPDAHHADLIGENVTAFLGARGDRHGTLTHQQSAHDFHRGGDAMHLGVFDGRLARLVESLGLLAAHIGLGANPVHFLHGRCQLLIRQLGLRRPFRRQLGLGHQQLFALAVCFLPPGAGTPVELLAHAAGVHLHLTHPVTPAVVDGEQFGLFGFDLGVNLRDLHRFQDSVRFAHRRHAGIDRLSHQLASEEIGAAILCLFLFIGRLPVRVFSHSRFVGVFDARLLRVPLGSPAHLDFAPGPQIGDGLGELGGIGIKLRDDAGLAGSDLGQLLLLIVRQGNGILARAFIVFERLLKVRLHFGLSRTQLRQLLFAAGFLLINARQLTVELGDSNFLIGRLLQKFAGRFHGGGHFVNRHVLDQLEGQHTDQRQPHNQHEPLLPAMTGSGPDGQRQFQQLHREDGRANRTDAKENDAHAAGHADHLLIFPSSGQNDELHDGRHYDQWQGQVGYAFAFPPLPRREPRDVLRGRPRVGMLRLRWARILHKQFFKYKCQSATKPRGWQIVCHGQKTK